MPGRKGLCVQRVKITPPSITSISSAPLALLTKGELQLPAPLLYSCFKSCTKYICQHLSSCERRAGYGLVGFFPCQCSVGLRVEKQVPATSPKGALTLSQTLCQVPNVLYFTSSTTRPLKKRLSFIPFPRRVSCGPHMSGDPSKITKQLPGEPSGT